MHSSPAPLSLCTDYCWMADRSAAELVRHATARAALQCSDGRGSCTCHATQQFAAQEPSARSMERAFEAASSAQKGIVLDYTDAFKGRAPRTARGGKRGKAGTGQPKAGIGKSKRSAGGKGATAAATEAAAATVTAATSAVGSARSASVPQLDAAALSVHMCMRAEKRRARAAGGADDDPVAALRVGQMAEEGRAALTALPPQPALITHVAQCLGRPASGRLCMLRDPRSMSTPWRDGCRRRALPAVLPAWQARGMRSDACRTPPPQRSSCPTWWLCWHLCWRTRCVSWSVPSVACCHTMPHRCVSAAPRQDRTPPP